MSDKSWNKRKSIKINSIYFQLDSPRVSVIKKKQQISKTHLIWKKKGKIRLVNWFKVGQELEKRNTKVWPKDYQYHCNWNLINLDKLVYNNTYSSQRKKSIKGLNTRAWIKPACQWKILIKILRYLKTKVYKIS